MIVHPRLLEGLVCERDPVNEPSSGRDVGGYVLNQSYKSERGLSAGCPVFVWMTVAAKFRKLEGGQLVSGPDAFHVLAPDRHSYCRLHGYDLSRGFVDHPRSAELPRG